MAKPNFTHLQFNSLFGIVKIIEIFINHKIVKINELSLTLQSSGAFCGNLPVKDSIKISNYLKIIKISKNNVELTHSGNLIKKYMTKFSHQRALRELIYIILKSNKFVWLANSNKPFNIFRLHIPSNWLTILDNCGLLIESDEFVTIWWARLFSKYNLYKEKRKKDIGNEGELICFKIEQNRILSDGIDPSLKVNLVSSIDDEYGFDISSIKGRFYDGDNMDEILIEVKSSENELTDVFKFHISRNEWNVAIENMNKYYFYCLAGVKLNGTYTDGPFFIKPNDIKKLMPINVAENIQWTNCTVIIDLNDINISKLLVY